MRQTMFVAALFVLVAFVPVRAEDKANKLVGKWAVTECHKDGKQDESKDKTVTVTSDTITCHDKDKKTEMACKYKLDTSSKPNTITMTCTEGEHKGKKLEGIVEVSGDTARISFSKPDEKAPTAFGKTKEGQCSITLKRAD